MFLTDCRTCGLRELRGSRSVDVIGQTDQGLALVYQCTRCGSTNLLGADQPRAPRGSLVAA